MNLGRDPKISTELLHYPPPQQPSLPASMSVNSHNSSGTTASDGKGTTTIGSRITWSRNYTAKDISFGVESCALMLKGVVELAYAVKTGSLPPLSLEPHSLRKTPSVLRPSISISAAGLKVASEQAQKMLRISLIMLMNRAAAHQIQDVLPRRCPVLLV